MKQLEHYEVVNKFQDLERKEICFGLYNVGSLENIATVCRVADALGRGKVYLWGKSKEVWEKHKKRIDRISRGNGDLIEMGMSWEEIEKKFGESVFLVEITDTSESAFDLRVGDFPILLIGGEEQGGIPPEILQKYKKHLHLPMLGGNSSLNVAMALGIVGHVILKNLNGNLNFCK